MSEQIFPTRIRVKSKPNPRGDVVAVAVHPDEETAQSYASHVRKLGLAVLTGRRSVRVFPRTLQADGVWSCVWVVVVRILTQPDAARQKEATS